ncbi:hypothetical protein GEV33_006101 [Tenebrio molitor]|uniref:Uncharacterized protein n=1 Tax=Tenebrio molitor TaxID=7067 RepID=A0A8J6HL92_TENMO|nr:hypothetical protein GEV33_006101 [Tenebrio molitor]
MPKLPFYTNHKAHSVLKSSATPRANGQCERYKGTIVNALAATSAGSAEDEWDTFVKQVQSALNCTYNKSIAVSSLEALAGYKPRHVANSNILSAVQDELSRMDLAELRSKIHQRITKDQKAQKERFDKTRAATTKYVKGQLVMVSNAVSSTGTSKKLLPKFKGPLRVRTVLPNDRDKVEDPGEGRKLWSTANYCLFHTPAVPRAHLKVKGCRLNTPLLTLEYSLRESVSAQGREGRGFDSDSGQNLKLKKKAIFCLVIRKSR